MAREKMKPMVADSLVRKALPPCRHYLSTGSTLLDLAVSDRHPGGIGSGRTVQIIGDNSTAKTVVMKEILGAAQRLGGYAVEEDAEYTPDFLRAALFGLNVGDWETDESLMETVKLPLHEAMALGCPRYCYRNPVTIEEVFDGEIAAAVGLAEGRIGEGKKAKKVDPLPGPIAIGIDTFTALPSLAEQKEDLDASSYRMERAKRMSAGFRKYLGAIARNDITVVAVDHIRDKVGVEFGPRWTTSGGKAMQQYASTRIFLAKAGRIKVDEIEIGVKIRARVVKNKIAPPGREVHFSVLYDYGIDDLRDCLEFLKDNDKGGKLQVNGAWYSWGEERLGQGLEAAIKGAETMGLEAKIAAEAAKAWHRIHAAPDRKPKER